ncbi:MAG TPA: mannose-1-phosphate guanyltransferase [Anaerolineae bacterium]|nr:mannose-1-phosphate guanyltransferase [Anaerolineae bacterium]
MKAVVMAGGSGSRLRPLTIQRPKPMIPIVNKPVISHILDLLKQHGFTDVVITVQYLADMIQDYFGTGASLGMNIRYSVEETPLGTAGSVKNAKEFLDEPFVVISGDALTNFNLTDLLRYHKHAKTLATLAIYNIANPVEYGVITINPDGQITRFQEKPSRGSVMSDHVNTGIYVLEPEILDFVPDNSPFDFANDLFPLLYEKGYPLYGYIAQGYWCDVGNIAEYMRANAEALEGRIEGLDLGPYAGDHIWTGQDVEISPSARLEGPIYLGNSVQIKDDVHITGPTVIRDYTVVDNGAQIDRSVLWRNCYIGERVQLNGGIVLRQCSIKTYATVFESAVIGDGTIIGEGAVIHPSVKIWPGKEVEPGAIVNSSIIWGSQGRRVLFGRYGVTGVVNIDLTPEFSSKLGAAFGATLPKGANVTINRDTHRSPRMIKRAIISGLPSAGVNVWDLGSQPIPVARYFTKISQAAGGVHVRLSPFDQRVVDIRFMNQEGLNISKNEERTIERIFFREDFRRVYLDDIGIIEYAQRVRDRYIEDFLKRLNTKAIQNFGFNLVVDFADAPLASVLPFILDELRCNVVALNANVDKLGTLPSPGQIQTTLKQMQLITTALGAQLGVHLDPGGEKIMLVDDRGNLLKGVTTCALLVELALRDAPGSSIALPTNLPIMFEQIAERYGGRIIRTEMEADALVKATLSNDVILGGDGRGRFIFPDFQNTFDGMMAMAKLLEYLATQRGAISDIVLNLPPYYVAERRVSCVWEAKPRVMRLLNDKFRNNKNQETEYGIKVTLGPHSWVLIVPDPDQPYFRINAEAESQIEAEALADEYAQTVENISPLE